MKISQTEARQLRRRVAQLEDMERIRRARYLTDYPGTNIANHRYGSATDFLPAVIRNSRLLGHAVVVTCSDDGVVRYYAIPHPEQPA